MEATTKHFKKREAILSCLRMTDTHPSAESLYQMLHSEHPDISLATVYRNLAWFKDRGMIISVGTVQGVERFDGNIAPHVHHVCCECGKVLDLPGISVPEELSQAAAAEICGQVTGCQLIFTGRCNDCVNTKN